MGYSPWSHKVLGMAEHAHTRPGLTAEGSGYNGETPESFKATRVYPPCSS